MAAVQLTIPSTGKVLEVPEESADYWRSLGYRDAEAPKKDDTQPIEVVAQTKPAPRKAKAKEGDDE